MDAAALASGTGHAPGKGHRDENFPVASMLVAKRHRAPIMAFYRFARAADDIADDASASAAQKHAALAEMRRGLGGTGDAEPARALHRVMTDHRLDRVHADDLLDAFVQDVDQDRYADWEALIVYCAKSAMPVGRYVLDVHGEDRAIWPASDALCAALQVINHLQDCGKDYRALGRTYLPEAMLAQAGASRDDLGADRSTPALRLAIAAAAERTRRLLDKSAPFADQIADRRLAAEVAVIQALAEDLARRLRTHDPLAERVHHRKPEALAIAARAALPVLLRWRRR